MTPTLQDLIDSAKLCGHKPWPDGVALQPSRQKGYILLRKWDNDLSDWTTWNWNPREDGNQDREIRDALLAKGYEIAFRDGQHQLIWNDIYDVIIKFESSCPANDFLTLAGAHVWRIENG